jgi:hypothetical protein
MHKVGAQNEDPCESRLTAVAAPARILSIAYVSTPQRFEFLGNLNTSAPDELVAAVDLRRSQLSQPPRGLPRPKGRGTVPSRAHWAACTAATARARIARSSQRPAVMIMMAPGTGRGRLHSA